MNNKYCPFCGEKIEKINDKYNLFNCEKAKKYHDLSQKRKLLIKNYFSSLSEIDSEMNSLVEFGLKNSLIHASKHIIEREEKNIKEIENNYINPGFFS